jgi:hypothetical protein
MGWVRSQFAFTGSIKIGAGAMFPFSYDTPLSNITGNSLSDHSSMIFAGESRL